MTRENVLFGAVGLLLGYLIAFHVVVHVNQGEAGSRLAASSSAAGQGADEVLPPDHPALPTNEVKDRQRLLSAAEAAARAARESPKDFDAQAKAADAYMEAGSFEDAIDFLTRANELRPDDYGTLVKLGNSYTAAERYETAEKWYKAALAKKPSDPDV
ncbi:MAG TPA: tetratricopeptide repeat protein, partial [Pyrinomonadaceae bacterium]|nr:tetratricopeptide repeat protein [Pyrinomonadaceae bacterium]